MHQSRRSLLKLIAAATVSSLFISGSVRGQLFSRDKNSTLLAFLETLLPGDSSQLLLAKIQQEYKSNLNQKKLVDWGCLWLDSQAKSYGKAKFYLLSAKQQIAIVQVAEKRAKTSAEYYFFSTLRNAAMTHYYSSFEGLAALGFTQPPQPLGYPQHNKAPRDKA